MEFKQLRGFLRKKPLLPHFFFNFPCAIWAVCEKGENQGKGVGKQGYGNRTPIDDRNPIRKFSIDCLDGSKTND